MIKHSPGVNIEAVEVETHSASLYYRGKIRTQGSAGIWREKQEGEVGNSVTHRRTVATISRLYLSRIAYLASIDRTAIKPLSKLIRMPIGSLSKNIRNTL